MSVEPTGQERVGVPFAATLRVRPEAIRIAGAGERTLRVRVQMPEVWDAVLFEAPPRTSLLTLKQRALEELYPRARGHDSYVLKLRGFEMLDEEVTLAEAGVADGSVFLLTHRRRRPVR